MSFDTLIDAAALAALIDSGTVAVLDCQFDLADPALGAARYRAGHLPGAQYLHLDADLSAPPTGGNGRHPLPDPAVLAATLRRLGVRAGQQVVAYDGSGGIYAARLWWLLRWMGHRPVAVLDGGLAAWTGALETGPGRDVPAGDFTPADSAMPAPVDAAAVRANIDDRGFVVVDARSADRFAGQPHPLDPVAGHIPGARNRFFGANLAPDGRFKPAAQLRAELAALLGETPPARIVSQCGSGVTACHTLLALEIAGLPGARLYPGSWSEWIADPSRPIERP